MGLRELRKRQRLSLEAVAYLTGDEVNISTISRIERGLTKPRPETTVKLARALGVSVTRLREALDEDSDRAAV